MLFSLEASINLTLSFQGEIMVTENLLRKEGRKGRKRESDGEFGKIKERY